MMERKKLTCNENNSDNGIEAFHINKNGFPIDDATWNRMWKIATKIYPEAKKDMEEIKNSDCLAEVPASNLPTLTPHMTVPQSIHSLQDFIVSFGYNHTGTQLFEIKKSRPLAGLMDKAKEIIREALPIKCLEAVILAIYITNSLSNVERFPIGFKSVFNGKRYYHVVLGIYYNGYFGALGMSRREDLMDKPLKFNNLFDMVLDYKCAYARYTHELKKVRFGGLVSHDCHSQEKILWGLVAINFSKTSISEQQHITDHYSKGIRSHFGYILPVFPKKETVIFSKPLHHNVIGKKGLKKESKSALSPVQNSSKDTDAYHVKV